MIKLKNKKSYYIIGLILLFAVGSFIWTINSEPYNVAKKFIVKSKPICNSLGPLTLNRLTIVGFKSRSAIGKSEFSATFLAMGEIKSGLIYIKLENNTDFWVVKKVELNAFGGNDLKLEF